DTSKSLHELRTLFNQIIKGAEDFRINVDTSLNIYVYTDMEANNNVILVPDNRSSNMEFIDTIKDYNPDVIYAQTGNPLNLDKLHSFYHYPWYADKPQEDLRASFIGTL
ncbi:23928_t:CDS:2, partial [Racocetra persica]